MFRWIAAIPVLGFLLRLTNTYAYGGDYAAKDKFAGVWRWVKAFTFPLLLACALTIVTVWSPMVRAYQCHLLTFADASDFVKKPGALILAVNPSLLGFGIGVYALIFGLAEPFVKQFKALVEQQKKTGSMSHGSELMLNSDLAFPLIVLVVSIAVGTIQQANEENVTLALIAWVAFWYSMAVMIEMISVIFRLAENSLLDKGQTSGGKAQESDEADQSHPTSGEQP